MSIEIRMAAIRQQISRSLAAPGRPQGADAEVVIVAVSKNHTVQAVREALAAGAVHMGENRLQEALPKQEALAEAKLTWHLIGHLQTNKAKQAVGRFALIHSVDSERLAAEIEKVAARQNCVQSVLLQVNIGNEESKFGVEPEGIRPLAEYMASLPHLRLCGLMAMAPFYEEAEQARPLFRQMYGYFRELKEKPVSGAEMRWLSMGMSHDFTVAIEEGANLVRIGTALFGMRDYSHT